MYQCVAVFGKSLKIDSLNRSRLKYHYFEEHILGKTRDDYFSTFYGPGLIAGVRRVYAAAFASADEGHIALR